MPEIKNTFQAGRMNKDLDERLVPSGEYRDALNIDVSTSEGSDVGTAQNSWGNIKKTFQGQVGNSCVGSVQNGSDDKIVFLVAGTTANSDKIDMIIEYNTTSGVTKNIITDFYNVGKTVDSATSTTLTLEGSMVNIRVGMTVTNGGVTATVVSISGSVVTISADIGTPTSVIFIADRVLNFKKENKITGINIIEGILFFTDNVSEPKRVNVSRHIAGTVDGSTHSKFWVEGVDQGYLKEEHVTVIRKYPLSAPLITMDNSTTGGTISGSCDTGIGAFTYTNSDSEVVNIPTGSSYTTTPQLAELTFTGLPDWAIGDTIRMKADSDDADEDTQFECRINIDSIVTSGNNKVVQATLLSLSEGITSAVLTWDSVKDQKDPFYELMFPRFSYRWKYVDGEYSVFSPFSSVAFLPEKEIGFDYQPKNGYNLAMTNNVRKLTVSGLETPPPDVVEVDILYKESNNTNIYTVETLKGAEMNDDFIVTSEQVHALLPSNQLLRPYDNVPRTAKSQEISGNRLIYGNYVQQFDIEEDPKFEITHKTGDGIAKIPQESLKSIRNYQIGVVYLDKYGRQTPVLSNDSATVSINQQDAVKINTIQAKLTTATPSWATHYKYYIKEPSASYYNLAMDRFYPAEDGNVWLSFASAERNKLDTDDYLILKKEHDNDEAVFNVGGGTSKYKVLAIENSAPDFLKEQKTLIGSIKTQFGFGSGTREDGFPEEDYVKIIVAGSEISGSTLENIATDGISDKFIRITAPGSASNYYAVASISRVDTSAATPPVYNDIADPWTITIKKPFGVDIGFVGKASSKTLDLSLEWYKEELDLFKAEFAGRFFVKINKDSFLEDKVLKANKVTENYMVKDEQGLFYINNDVLSRSTFQGGARFGIDHAKLLGRHHTNLDEQGVGITQGSKRLDIRLWDIHPDEKTGWEYPDYGVLTGSLLRSGNGYNFHMKLRTTGTFLRFKDDPNGEVYKIVKSEYNWGYNWSTLNRKKDETDNHGIRYSLTLDKPINFQPFKMSSGNGTVATTQTNLLGVTTPSNAGSLQHDGSNAYPVTKYGGSDSWKKSFSEMQIVEAVDEGKTFTSTNPAIWETEPKERIDLNLYYETPDTHAIADSADFKELNYSNVMSFANGVESNRIRDDFNAVTIDKGPRVSTELKKQYKKETKTNGLIFSGIFNSTSGVNRLNEFIQAEAITKDLNPGYGSIQKLFTRNTNIIVFCEDKTLKVLVDKDALYSAGGNAQLTSTNKVLGQSIPFQGEFGISTNPESFASFGFRVYYTDRNRNAILRLSGDGIEEITRYGMSDFFKDTFKSNRTGHIIGTYDEDKGNYNITFPGDSDAYVKETVSFTENVKGWTSRKSFYPENGISLNGQYYTFDQGELWLHNENALRNNFYGSQGFSSIKFLFNQGPSVVKNFKTINYEGTASRLYNSTVGSETSVLSEGWYNPSIETDLQSGSIKDFVKKEGKYFNYIKGLETTWNNITNAGNLDMQEFTSQGIGEIKTITDDGALNMYKLTITENAD